MRLLLKATTRLRAHVSLSVAAMAAAGTWTGWAQSAPAAPAQPAVVTAPASASPLAIVPIDSSDPSGAATVTGALEVAGGKAMIGAGGSITSGSRTTQVVLPRRGMLRVCASTTVKLAADSSVPAGDKPGGDAPGLLMALDHGAVEVSFATTSATSSNADILLTPDFRILVAGPGSSELKVRLAEGGDTCIDNSGASAPYVVVTSLFDSGLYRVQPGQRIPAKRLPSKTGTVTFLDGSTSIGFATLSGKSATFSTTQLPVGTNQITAVYEGDSGDLTSTSAAVSVVVTPKKSSP